jgi:hypothetical protein
MGFEPATPVFERAETVHALDRAATVIGIITNWRDFISNIGGNQSDVTGDPVEGKDVCSVSLPTPGTTYSVTHLNWICVQNKS